MEKRMHVGRSVAIATISMVVLTCSGCAGFAAPLAAPGATTAVTEPTAAEDEARLMRTLGFLNISETANIVFSDMDSIGEMSEAVAYGTITRWLRGDSYSSVEGMEAGGAILAEFVVGEIAQAQPESRLSAGETIYIPFTVSTGIDEMIAGAPAPLDTLVYLDHQLSSEELTPNDAYVVTPGDPEAAGAPRWVPQSTQGFVIVDPADATRLYWPRLGISASGELSDAAPGGTLDGLTPEQRETVVSVEPSS